MIFYPSQSTNCSNIEYREMCSYTRGGKISNSFKILTQILDEASGTEILSFHNIVMNFKDPTIKAILDNTVNL